MRKAIAVLSVLSVGALSSMGGTGVDSIVDAATVTWTAVAVLCVTIGTFVIGYRLARKVR